MNPRLDTPLDRREAVSALLVMLAAVMGLGALPEPVAADDAIPAVYIVKPDGTPEPTHAWLLAFSAQAWGKDDETAEAMLSDALAVHRHYGTEGLRAKMREMKKVAAHQ